MILMPTGVLMPVESMLMRFSMGKGQALASPGKLTTSLRPGWRCPSGSVQPKIELLGGDRPLLGPEGLGQRRLEPARPAAEEMRRPCAAATCRWSGSSCTTVSIIESGAGSVAVSARPILPWTLITSGKVLINLSVCWSSSLLLVTLMLGSVVGM